MYIIFDLDKTIWNCTNKHGVDIWAKQIIPPLKVEGDVLIDDVGSSVVLMPGIRALLSNLKERGIKVGFLSVGRYHSLPDDRQPSLLILQAFELFNFFTGIRVLEYKSFRKLEVLAKVNEPVIFFDDSDDVLNDVGTLSHVQCIDSKYVSDYANLNGVIL